MFAHHNPSAAKTRTENQVVYRVMLNIAVIGVACLGCSVSSSGPHPATSDASLPAAADIAAINVHWDQLNKGGAPPKKEFRITSDFEKILDALKPNRHDASPAKWESGCSLKFEMKDGSMKTIYVFWPGTEPAEFKIQDQYYRGGSMKDLDQALHDFAK